MELIVKWLIGAVFIGMLGVVIYVQRNSLIDVKDRLETANKTITDRDGTITSLKQINAKNKQAAVKLQTDHNNIHNTLAEREIMIENLQNEDADIRRWSDTPLPDVIAGMRQHGTITGTDAYLQRLPARDTVQPASDSAQD